LQPLPIPERPWISVSMDFIVGFPKVDGMDTVMVIVDKFSKYAVFMATPSVCTTEVAVGDRVLLKLTPQIWKKIVGKIGTVG